MSSATGNLFPVINEQGTSCDENHGFSFVWQGALCYNGAMKIQHNKEKFTQQLLTWYDKNARILPWREDRSSYRVWVSEIMLQQTRVEAVKPYFERFMKHIPTLKDLAEADDDTLSKLWEGLGYYHRVRNMKKCAQECMQKYNGALPCTAQELKQLPGIGDYTAGAVASIACGECIPAVDGNVLRVFSRVLVSEDDILKEATKKKFKGIIQPYIPPKKSAEFNQALMELGALICVPNAAPRCNICPVASECMGYQSGNAQRLPNKTPKKQRRIEERTIILLVCEGNVLLHQRPQDGLLAGLYEFINLEGNLKKKDIAAIFAQLKVINIVPLHKAKHIFSHIEWHMIGYLVEVTDANSAGLWCSWDALEHTYALPAAFKVYRDALQLWLKEN